MWHKTSSVFLVGLGILCLLVGGRSAEAKNARTSAPKIDLYTMGVGDHVTEKFGHAALCTRYPNAPRRDRCYNYGTTNFKDLLGMGWGFIRGRSRFWVSVISPTKMMNFYTFRDRDVWVQEIPLSDEKAQAVADKLHFDSLEENRYYNYHHYRDNCTTRIRDILDTHTGGALSQESETPVGPSYRALTRRGFAHMPMVSIASDYVLGRVGDHTPSEHEAMFLPEVFRESVRVRLKAEPVHVYERGGADFDQSPNSERIYVLLLGLLLALPLWQRYRRQQWSRFAAFPAVMGLFWGGLILWLLAILSPLPMARFNENLLLMFPGDLALLFLGAAARQRYAQVRVVIALLATAAAGVGILSQPLWAVAVFPILVLLPCALGIPDRSAPKRKTATTESSETAALSLPEVEA